MSRIACLALVLAACSSAPRPIANSSSVPTRYALEPLQLHGGEGMHSMSQSWTTVAGSLEMHAKQATLHLAMTTERSFVHCPKEWQDGSVSTMQACAPPDAKDTTSTASLALTGETRRENGQLVISVREDDRAATLACDEHGRTLACTIDDDYTLFGRVGAR